MSAKDVIAAALYGCGIEDSEKVEVPEILNALAASGYAVVQLPEPTIDHHDLQNGGESAYYEFSDGSDSGTVGAYPGSGVIYSADGWEWTPEGARDVAASWLAASIAAQPKSGQP